PSPDDENTMDYFLGPRPKGATNDSRVDLGDIVRDIEELAVFNDEAHHIHDPKMAWFKSILDIHNRLLQREKKLSIQIDVTATPRHNNGAIFVQTVADYPLVEAIKQNVVKHPVLPDAASRTKLVERPSAKYTEKYADYLHLGVIEWRKAYEEHRKLGKKAVLFVMTDDTRNCDDVAEYLEENYPDLKDVVHVIHTKNNGEISEAASGKSEDQLKELRRLADTIDNEDNPYKAIVSVLMLKEGWDVRNVTTIVGLRAYSSKSDILPEQTLGRGIRRMYPGADGVEYVSVIGTDAFMEFVESIQQEGVDLERKAMGEGTGAKAPLIVEVDHENPRKDLDALDIRIPLLTPRIYREYKSLSDLDIAAFSFQTVGYLAFSDEEQREIVFRDIITGEITHTTKLDSSGVADYRSVIGYFARTLMKELRLVSGYDVLYEKVRNFVRDRLFGNPISLEDPNTLRNLSELVATRTLLETFKREINALTVQDKGDAEIRDWIKLRTTRPFTVKEQGYIVPKKSVFNRIIGDSPFELAFASFLEQCDDVDAFAKNYLAVNFRLEYQNSEGTLVSYIPDFFVKLSDKEICIVETKGHEDLDDPLKIRRLRLWCEDMNRIQREVQYSFVFVDQENFESRPPKTFRSLMKAFRKYQD
ncbi:MAG: type III restriction endonuclease subunit R, partial [bacterium]